jgi:hypothetical protein
MLTVGWRDVGHWWWKDVFYQAVMDQDNTLANVVFWSFSRENWNESLIRYHGFVVSNNTKIKSFCLLGGSRLASDVAYRVCERRDTSLRYTPINFCWSTGRWLTDYTWLGIVMFRWFGLSSLVPIHPYAFILVDHWGYQQF